jgi:hypothetical protein
MTDQLHRPHYNARLLLGHVVATPRALRLMLLNRVDPYALLNRHATGDWSAMCIDDQIANVQGARDGYRVFSSYRVGATEKVWVITEADRSVTTFLLPDEY